MNKALPALAVLALGAMTWFILSRPADVPAPDAPASIASAGPSSRAPKPLPRAALEPEAPPSKPVDFAFIKARGLLGQSSAWIADRMQGRGFKPVDGEVNTWKSERATVRWIVDAGRIVGADIDFIQGSLSADVGAIGPLFVGDYRFLPLYLEADRREDAKPTSGRFEIEGDRFEYSATYHTAGEGPYGPAHLELRFK